MAAGDFTASTFADIILKQEALFADPRSTRELQYPIDSARALLENQMVSFPEILKGRQCPTVKAVFLKSCGSDPVDITDEGTPIADCDITGNELESDSIELEALKAYQWTFSVFDDQCADIYQWQDKMAYGLAVGRTKLEKEISENVVAFLQANAMNNLFTGTIGTIAGNQTNFTANLWTPDLLADWHIATVFNQINNPVLLTGTNFMAQIYNAQFNFANTDQKDQRLKFDAWSWYADPRTVDAIAGQSSTFLFDAGAAAFWPKNEYMSNVPVEIKADLYAYAMPSRLQYRDGNTLKTVMLDVIVQRDCTVATVGHRDVRRPGWHVDIQVAWGLQLGPLDCAAGTGILEFVKTAEV